MYRVDELLLLELVTYLPEKAPFRSVLHAGKTTVGEFIAKIDRAEIDDGKTYAALMNGFDWKNILMAMERNPGILHARIAESHLDKAYGGGGGISAVFLNDETGEAVVAFRGTASAEWLDDFLGANQIDSLQQINALEWYKAVYDRLDLGQYDVTVIGHSKGGNKAKYIAVLNDTPVRCVAFDGQGFSDEFVEHYRKEILKRQDIIENHNIDFDYVNILMNDIGRCTYYIGYDYGKHGFAESHSPCTFFNFGENGEYSMQANPSGQRPEMQILNQFVNSLIRSGVSRKEQLETNRMMGMLVEEAFAIGKAHTTAGYINFLCDLVSDPQYCDNMAYLLAFCIKYSRMNPDLFKALKNTMHSFHADQVVKTLDMLEDLVQSRRFGAYITVSDFLIQHVNSVMVRQVQAYCSRKYRIDLTFQQIRGLLQIVCMTRQTLRTLEIRTDGTDAVIREEPEDEAPEDLPQNFRIVVLAGGLSKERNLSLKSGYILSEALSGKGHRVILLDAYMGYGEQEEAIRDAFAAPEKYSLAKRDIPDSVADLWAVRKRRTDQSCAYFGPNVIQICRQADLVFIALHGAEGQSGKVQAMFDLLGIDYTGCDYYTSALASNKFVSKQLLAGAGVPVPKGFLTRRGQEPGEPEARGMQYPVIVKPNNSGLGLGISVANDPVSYRNALERIFRWESDIMVEEYTVGREFAVCMLEGKALPVIEALPLETRDRSVGMLLRGETVQRCPAEIPEALAQKLTRAAEKVCAALGVKGCGKVTFIVREDGSFVCLECDALPQLYQDAHLAQEAAAAGISFGDLCDRMIRMSIRKE